MIRGPVLMKKKITSIEKEFFKRIENQELTYKSMNEGEDYDSDMPGTRIGFNDGVRLTLRFLIDNMRSYDGDGISFDYIGEETLESLLILSSSL